LPSWFSSSLGFSPPSPPGDRRHPFRSRASFTIRSLASPDRDCTTASSQTRKWRALSQECQPFRGFFLVPSRQFEAVAVLGYGFPGGTRDVAVTSTPPAHDCDLYRSSAGRPSGPIGFQQVLRIFLQNLYLHLSTSTFVRTRDCHSSVAPSLNTVVWEY
jgi:hypothetical protein